MLLFLEMMMGCTFHTIILKEQTCERSNLHLNLSKCSIMYFSRLHVATFNYSLYNCALVHTAPIRDLDAIFDTKLNFSSYVTSITNRVTSRFAFIKGWSKQFNHNLTTETLLTSFDRPVLEAMSR